MFDRLTWKADRMLLDELVFRLEHSRNTEWELGDECFVFQKTKPLVDQYAIFWRALSAFRVSHILELGIWDGGSMAFWCEYFKPQLRRYVGIDKGRYGESPYFRRYLASRGLEPRVTAYWGVDQADSARLREIVGEAFDGPLDLIMDDASHMYSQTRKSFEALFPFLRPGGLYVIEDWAWAHWKEFQPPDHPWAGQTPLTRLICELVEATGTSTELISGLRVHEGFAVVERGPLRLADPSRFRLDNHIVRRQEPPPLARLLWRVPMAFRRAFAHSHSLRCARRGPRG